MAREYASPGTFVSTVVVDNWKGTGKTVTMNTSDYVPERDGQILDGPTQPPPTLSVMDDPHKDPKVDDQGRAIAEQHSPLHRA